MTRVTTPLDDGGINVATIELDADGRIASIAEFYHDRSFLEAYQAMLAEMGITEQDLRRLRDASLSVARQTWLERTLSVAVRRTHARLADMRRRERERRMAQPTKS